MRLRLVKIDEYQLLTCLKHGVWGSKSARFSKWNKGDKIVFLVDKGFAAMAEINGEPYRSKEIIWDNGEYPHRIPICFTHYVESKDRLPILGKIREVITNLWGTNYGWGILNQHLIEDPESSVIADTVVSRQNILNECSDNLQIYLDAAKIKRDIENQRRKRKKAKKANIELFFEDEQKKSKKEISLHTKAQSELIALGNISGCSVWIASNDQSKKYGGRNLIDDCIDKLPNLGLNEEALKTISLIDVIWIKRNAPVCAFEIETTTSIYSGLLRMADLLTVVPAINIKIFIVAPSGRQAKVMRELSRPTFQKIGLSEYCRYISTEELSGVLSKIKGLEGHIQPSILDTISIEHEEQ